MKEFDASKHFAKLLASGQFKVDKDGRMLIEGINVVALPALTAAKIWKDVEPELLREIGRYQGMKAIEVHSKFFGLVRGIVSKVLRGVMDKVLNFALVTFSTVGWGRFEIEKFDSKKGEIIITNKVNPIARCYLRDFGKAKKPIDHFFCGLFEGAISGFLKQEAKCTEVKCIACGDEVCVFCIHI
jgi:predicted hydrocarbon binding protein